MTFEIHPTGFAIHHFLESIDHANFSNIPRVFHFYSVPAALTLRNSLFQLIPLSTSHQFLHSATAILLLAEHFNSACLQLIRRYNNTWFTKTSNKFRNILDCCTRKLNNMLAPLTYILHTCIHRKFKNNLHAYYKLTSSLLHTVNINQENVPPSIFLRSSPTHSTRNKFRNYAIAPNDAV